MVKLNGWQLRRVRTEYLQNQFLPRAVPQRLCQAVLAGGFPDLPKLNRKATPISRPDIFYATSRKRNHASGAATVFLQSARRAHPAGVFQQADAGTVRSSTGRGITVRRGALLLLPCPAPPKGGLPQADKRNTRRCRLERFLTEGCDLVQGFLFSRPKPAEDIVQ